MMGNDDLEDAFVDAFASITTTDEHLCNNNNNNDPLPADSQMEMGAPDSSSMDEILRSSMESFNQHTIPDFSAINVRQVPSTTTGQILTFHSMDVADIHSDDVNLHGNFDLERGLFTANSRGFYLFIFSGVAEPVGQACAQLLVNGANVRATSLAQPVVNFSSSAEALPYGTLSFYTPMALNSGDTVCVYLASGRMNPDFTDRFSGIFLQ